MNKMDEYTIEELQDMMSSGKITSKKLVKDFLKRIDEIDKNGPKLNSIIELNPDALEIADELDKERKKKGPRSKLHGIPVIIKDNINTADKMMTTAGSLALLNHIPSEDAFIVMKLREAGAIILGKANLSEWANFRSTRSTSGWSSRGGLTRNPYALDRNACGSSSGSAVAVAANLCCVAIGTETDGSVICPSQINGIVGIKPTIGLVSRTGIIPIAHSQDIAGPMGRSVADTAILLSALTGIDQQDESTANNEEKIGVDYTQFLDKDGLKGARIGVARNYFGFNPEVDRLMEEAIEAMKDLGATIVDPTNLENIREIRDAEYTVLLYEFKDDLNKYLAKYLVDNPNKTMKDIIEFNEKHKEKVMPYFGQEHIIRAEEKGPLTDEEYLKALEKCKKITQEEGIDKVLQEHNLDAIIAPSGSPTWPIDLINGDHHTGGSSSAAAVAGYPNITVPLGYIHGLPVGISFFSKAYNESVLIKLTYAFEQATRVRKPPKFLSTIKLD
ncbi:MAG: amidase [Asgard group archaeon]|nr:amidase [Asgard group archaeon]